MLDYLERHHNSMFGLLLLTVCVLGLVAIIDADRQEVQREENKRENGVVWEEIIDASGSDGGYEYKLHKLTIPEGTLYRATRVDRDGVGIGLTFVPNTVAERVKE